MKLKIFSLSLLFSFATHNLYSQYKISVIGTGYVGLVTGAGLAEFGNLVTCADIDEKKINKLNNGIMPIYEENLEPLVHKNVQANRLKFTTQVAHAIKEADVIFIAVDTPEGRDHAADLTALKKVIEAIAQNINGYTVIVDKSTVPVGTGDWIASLLQTKYKIPTDLFDVVDNPEFLREGTAVKDVLKPDRLVFGCSSEKALRIMHAIYQQLIEEQNTPVVSTNIVTAEAIKYASNAFLALKLGFINEIANYCDAVGADVQTIAHAMGLDARISPQFLKPGPGFGGSCFPKDSQALLHHAHRHGVQMHTVQAIINANIMQRHKPVDKLLRLMNHDITDKTIAILGLAFKANTDDVRYSPAIPAIQKLLEYGAHVKAYDPAAMENMQFIFSDIIYCASAYETVKDADAIIIMTEWKEFKDLDFAQVRMLVNQPIVMDARNLIDPDILYKHGFLFDTIGRSYLTNASKIIKNNLYNHH